MSRPVLPLPQAQSDVSELHRHDFPRQRHPERRAPDHRANPTSKQLSTKLRAAPVRQSDHGANASSETATMLMKALKLVNTLGPRRTRSCQGCHPERIPQTREKSKDLAELLSCRMAGFLDFARDDCLDESVCLDPAYLPLLKPMQ